MTEDQYAIMNTHSWESGMMYVHPEDVEHIAKTRVVECGKCEDVHPSQRPCPHAHKVTLELWGFYAEPVCRDPQCLHEDGTEGCVYLD